jgi:Protein of unknown function (DUF2762).
LELSNLSNLSLEQGIWVTLFIFIFMLIYAIKYVEKQNSKTEEREKNYQEFIRAPSNQNLIIEEIHQNIKELKKALKI